MHERHDENGFIPVVAAVIAVERRLLLCQRQDGPHLPLLWEFPGGKVDPGEGPIEALTRELREELGVESRIGPRIHEVRHTYPEKRVWIRFYVASIAGVPRPHIHRDLRWVDVGELSSYEVPPPNAQVVQQILTAGIHNLPSVRAPDTPSAGQMDPASA